MRINIVYDNSGRWPLFYKTGNVPGFAISCIVYSIASKYRELAQTFDELLVLFDLTNVENV